MKHSMKSILSAILAGLCIVSCVSCDSGDAPATGADSTDTPGTEAVHKEPARADVYVDAAAAEGGDGSETAPFQTITAARDYLRAADKSAVSGGITVHVAPGEYHTDGGLTFTAEDSGTADCPITYVSDEAQGASIRSGVTLDNSAFTALDDADGTQPVLAQIHKYMKK